MPVEEGVAHRKTGFSRKKKKEKMNYGKRRGNQVPFREKGGRKYNIGWVIHRWPLVGANEVRSIFLGGEIFFVPRREGGQKILGWGWSTRVGCSVKKFLASDFAFLNQKTKPLAIYGYILV